MTIFLLFSAAWTIVSCGGPYTARRINQPDEKLALAHRLFEKGKYSDAAVEYKDFLAEFAGDERSDLAQFRLAECYRLDGDYALAAVEYRILFSDYGYSEYVDDAFFLEGLCALRQTQRSERDQTKSLEALSRIKQFLRTFPNSPRRPEAEEVLREIHDILGKKEFLNARLYFRDNRYRAALVYFDKIIEFYPMTVWSARSHYYRGVIMEERGNLDEAKREYSESLSYSDGFPEKSDADRRLKALTEGTISER